MAPLPKSLAEIITQIRIPLQYAKDCFWRKAEVTA